MIPSRKSGQMGDQDQETGNTNSPDDADVGGIEIGKKIHSHSHNTSMGIPPSPLQHVSIDQLAEAANNFYKMSLIHEISVDANFKVEKPDEDKEESMQKTIKETMHRAFWDVQRSHLNADPPNYAPALSLLKEIKQSLHGLTLPRQASLRAQIDARLDLESAEAQLNETGKISFEAFATPVIETMAELCAPVRDADIASLRTISDPIEFFRQAFAVLDLMHMDLANFTIQKMRPYIRQQAGEYERDKFDTLLEVQRKAGIDGLAITRQWLRCAYEKLKELAKAPPSQAGAPRSTAPAAAFSLTPNNVLREAYLALLTWHPDSDFPETMTVDSKRIRELIDCLSRTVTLASLVLVVCNFAASNHACLIPAHAVVTPSVLPQAPMAQLKAVVCRDVKGIIDGMPADKIPQLAEELSLRMIVVIETWRESLNEKHHDDATVTPLGEVENVLRPVAPECVLPSNLKDQLTAQINAVLHKEHPVYKLMLTRAIDFVRSTISARPPDPIPLPTGFGAQISVPLDPSVCALQRPLAHRLPDGGDDASSTAAAAASSDLSRVYDLALIASRLMPLVAHNRHVFGPHYAEIIQGLFASPENSRD